MRFDVCPRLLGGWMRRLTKPEGILAAGLAALFVVASLVVQMPGLGGGEPVLLRLAVGCCALVGAALALLARGSFHPRDVAARSWGLLTLSLLVLAVGWFARVAETYGWLPRSDDVGVAEVLWLAGMVLMALALYGNMLHLNLVLGGGGLLTAVVLAFLGGAVITAGVVWPIAQGGSAHEVVGRVPDALYLVLSVVIAVPAVVVPFQMGRGEIGSVWLVFGLSLLAMGIGNNIGGWGITVVGGFPPAAAEIYMLSYLGMGGAAAVQWGLNGAPMRLRRAGSGVGSDRGGGATSRSERGAPGHAR